MIKLLHIPSGVIIKPILFEGELTLYGLFESPLDYFYKNNQYTENKRKEFESVRRLIDCIDDSGIWISGYTSYITDIKNIRLQLCKEEFEIIYD